MILPLARNTGILVQTTGDEVLIYDLITNKAFCLNETSALVWELCDGNKSLTDISNDLSKKLNAKVDEGLVWLALEQLKKEKLIENEVIAPAGYEGLTRREAIKKVGLASLIVIPVVMALSVPVAAASASVCGMNSSMNCACAASPAVCTGANPGVPAGGAACNGLAIAPSIDCTAGSGSPACQCNGPFTCGAMAGIKLGSCT